MEQQIKNCKNCKKDFVIEPEDFNFYETTGDMTNWLAKKGIPAISVLLTNHKDTEWSKNKAGIDALLKYYAK